MQEQETVIGQIVQFAMDPEIKAIVVCQAVPGSTAAFSTVRDMRDDIVIIAGVPHEDPAVVAPFVDLAMETDQLRRGASIAQLAAEMGAKKILHYSFPRHMSMELLAVRYQNMKDEAAKLGLEVIDVTAPDPMAMPVSPEPSSLSWRTFLARLRSTAPTLLSSAPTAP